MKTKNKIFDILFILIIGIISVFYTTKTLQNDTFYTVAIGKDILKFGVDMLDHFSIHSIAYTYPHWLYDLITYIVYNIGGFRLLYIFSMIIYFSIGMLLYYFTKNLCKSRFVSAFFAITAEISLAFFITTRAQSVTYILFIIELFLIEKFIQTSKKIYLIGLPIISILIVNLHCAVWIFFYILFLPYIAEYLLAWYKNKEIKIKRIYKPSGKYLPCKAKLDIFGDKISIEFNKNVKWLILIMILCVFTGFITLNSTTPYTYLLNTLKGDTTTWIGEHQPTVLRHAYNLIFYLITFIYVLSFLRQKIKLRHLFLMLGLFVLAFSSYRHISLLIICITYPLVDIFSTYIRENNNSLDDALISVFTKKVVMIVLIVLFLLVGLSNYIGNGIYREEYVNKEEFPIYAADYIVENLDVNNIRLFNEYNYGSYLLYRGIPVFIDSRADLYTIPFNGLDREITADFLDVNLNYNEIFEYYGITHVITYKYDEKYGRRVLYELLTLENDYNLIYEDEYFAIFEIAKTLK